MKIGIRKTFPIHTEIMRTSHSKSTKHKHPLKARDRKFGRLHCALMNENVKTNTLFLLADLSAGIRCLPDGEPILGVPQCEPSSPSNRNFSAAMSLPPARPHYPIRSTSPAKSHSPAEPPLRARSRSPPPVLMAPSTKIDLGAGHQYELNQLEFIRLTSFINPRRHFLLRRYTFPTDKPIQKLLRKNVYVRMPTQEQIALSTADGEVFAILETSHTLAGIYSHYGRDSGKGRVRINMESGKLTPLTKEEIREIPVGRNSKIVVHFRVEHINNNPPQH